MEEGPASFYLGREYDVLKKQVLPKPVLYDARHLTTHAVFLGMTGSGKTGLCINLLEEAALDGVPAIAIDPKGDLTNLLLTFPDLQPDDFQPWVNLDDARRRGLDVEQYAAETAQRWAAGLAEWGMSPTRIRTLRERAEFFVFTPGSDAGLSVNILQTLRAPALSWERDEEALREKIQATVSALLGLAGIAADPVKSREHILLAHLFEHAWRVGEDLDLSKLILQIQDPPVRKVGVFDVETFFPGQDRFALAVAMNRIIAAPSFENWLEGQPLDIDQILWRSDGRPRVSIFYLAHLSDAERMFFVTLLLAQVEAWMRKQSGTTSLRSLLYFDELFGYFPPYPANPPSKLPLLRLLKQARAFGLGLVLATQNPVDLDYKGLSNAGTWFIGKLQTDRDKMRVLEGLESADSAAGAAADRSYFDRLISSLDQRVFILHNVHADKPLVFMSRWAMSYLRGPLTKQQVRVLMEPYRKPEAALESPLATDAPVPVRVEAGLSSVPTQLGTAIPQYFLLSDVPFERALRREQREQGVVLRAESQQRVYEPMILAWARVHFQDARRQVVHDEEYSYLLAVPEDLAWIDWPSGRVILNKEDLALTPPGEGLYADLSPNLGEARRCKSLRQEFVNFLYRQARVNLYHNRALGLYSRVGEPQGRFVQRCQEQAAIWRKAEEEKLAAKFDARVASLEERLRREGRELEADRIEYEGRKREETLTMGESVLGMFTGRRRTRTFTEISRRRRLTSQSQADVQESEEVIGELEEQMERLRQEWEVAAGKLARRADDLPRQMEQVQIAPKKTGIEVMVLGLAWMPFWRVVLQEGSGARRMAKLPAYESTRVVATQA